MGAEKNFENKVKDFLKDQGCWFVKYWGGGEFTKAGIPDILCCCNGYFLGIEIKAPRGKPSELQKWNVQKINQCNGFGVILYPDHFDDFKMLIRALKDDCTLGATDICLEINERWDK